MSSTSRGGNAEPPGSCPPGPSSPSQAATVPPVATPGAADAFSASLDSYPFLFGPPPTPRAACQPDLPGYEILSELGRGGMGVVYKARQTCLNRLVAIKMILADAYAGPEDLARFYREAEAVARLQHPNIVQVHEIAEHEGRPFFSLEFVEGGNLANRLKGQPMVPRQAAKVVETLARAIQVTHEQGIIHRDLKPANILLTRDGVPKITDFGLAKYQGRETGQTQTGALVGTPSYMPPEQVRGGGPSRIGPPTDVYSLGAVLYELLTGRPPFLAATPIDTVFQVLSRDPAPPGQLQSRVPRDLETICLKCLSKNPGRRYPTAQALADDLGRFLAGKTIQARPVHFWERGLKWASRHKAAACLVLLLAVTPVFLFGALLRRIETVVQAKQDVTTAFLELAKESYVSNIALADRLWRQNSTEQARELLEVCPVNLRGWEWHYLQRSWHARLRAVHGLGGTKLAYTPDGRLLAVNCIGTSVLVRNALLGQTILTIARVGPVLALAGDGGRLATMAAAGGETAIEVHDTTTGKLIASLPGGAQAITELAFSRDGQFLAAAAANRPVTIFPLSEGRQPVRLMNPQGNWVALAVCEVGPLVAASRSDGNVSIWDTKTSRHVASLPAKRTDQVAEQSHSGDQVPSGGHSHPLVFSEDGKWLARGWRDTVEVWNWLEQRLLWSLQGHTGQVVALQFSHDGAHLVSCGADRTMIHWDLVTGKQLNAYRGHASPVWHAVFSPSGEEVAVIDSDSIHTWDVRPEGWKRLAFAGSPKTAVMRSQADLLLTLSPAGELDRWELATGKHTLISKGLGQPPTYMAAAADGRLLAAGGGDRVLHVWDIQEGREITRFREPEGPAMVLAFRGDGRLLAMAGGGPAIRLRDPADGHLLRSLSSGAEDVAALSFSPNGNRFVSCDRSGMVRLWSDDADRPQTEKELGDRNVIQVAVGPDDQNGNCCVIAADAQGKLSFSRLPIGGNFANHHGHAGAASILCLNPDGSRLVTAGTDCVLKLWDVDSGQEILTLGEFAVPILAAGFTPDGHRLVAVLQDGAIHTWDGSPETPVSPDNPAKP